MDKIQKALRTLINPIPANAIVVEAKVTPTAIVIPKSYSQWLPTEKMSHDKLKNLTHEELLLDKLSSNSKRKLERKLDWLLAITARGTYDESSRNYVLRNNCAVITLTLSDLQYHSDKYIKRQMLNVFLTELRKKYNQLLYIWKAEVQSNDNLHFHIICNQFISHDFVREFWNKIQSDNGYIKSYSHSTDSKSFPSTEVVGCKKVHNVRSYLLKYVSKSEEGRKIQGRLWSCSHLLSGFNVLNYEMSRENFDELERAVSDSKVEKIVCEYCIIYKADFRLLEKSRYRITKGKITEMINPFYDYLREGFFLDFGTGEIVPKSKKAPACINREEYLGVLSNAVLQYSIDDLFEDTETGKMCLKAHL